MVIYTFSYFRHPAGAVPQQSVYSFKMDDCNLEKLSIKPGKLSPVFKQDTLEYSVTVPSNVEKVTLDTLTRDSGASYTISVSKSFSKFSTTVMQIEESCLTRRHATQSALLKFLYTIYVVI